MTVENWTKFEYDPKAEIEAMKLLPGDGISVRIILIPPLKFDIAGAVAHPGPPQERVLRTTLVKLTDYGFDVIDQNGATYACRWEQAAEWCRKHDL